MRVLITGASGFVGRPLTQALSNRGHSIRAAARNLSAIPSTTAVQPVELPDLSRPLDWRPLLAGMDAVVHLAGIAHVSNGISEEQYDKVNRLATEGLAQTASATPGIKRFIFVSSIRAQSGPSSDHILTENDAPEPADAYGRSKLAAEDFVRDCRVPATILRPVAIYGAEARANVGKLMRLAALPFPLPLGAISSRRSLLAIENMISAIQFILEEPATIGNTYIVADRTPVSLADMISTLRQAIGRSPGLFSISPQWIRRALHVAGKSDVWERMGAPLVADASKLRAAGWRPTLDAPAGLAAMAHAVSPRKSGTASRNTR